MADDLRREMEELLRYCSEIVRRVGQGGIADVTHLVALYEQLRQALDAVSFQELTWAEERAKALIDKLLRLSSRLEDIRRVKLAMNGVTDGQARG
jgi:ribonuclease D